jgi:ATP-binding cassette subfamily F protein uup
LIELENVSYTTGGRNLLAGLDFVITAGMRVGLVGDNGTGKTTLLRLLRDETQPDAGTIRRAGGLRIVYFDQARRLDPDATLRRALAPDGDSVVYQDRLIHVASWGARFLFSSEQLNQPVGRLSGGERARVLIARLMLEPADVLLLDEPTNDLDIPTLEVLEESLLEFRGALVLVTHDRYLLDRVATVVLGLDGRGGAERFADYRQWEAWTADGKRLEEKRGGAKGEDGKAVRTGRVGLSLPRKRLSYQEAREFAGIEERIQEAERILDEKRAAFSDPLIASDGPRLLAAQREMAEAEVLVDTLYARWAELEDKRG